ncbi:cold shock domain-containing protein [Candidatus Kaiserbacteria bacterium]|nr:cold shock domain-containing protein [Candidatus Kaiserbacteria bacterium]
MKTGTVKWFNVQKGYGFIIPDERTGGMKDVYVHISVIELSGLRTLDAGQRLEYEDVTESPKKRAAVLVRLSEGNLPQEGRHRGVVVDFSFGRGFGYIKPDDNGRDIYVHIRDVERSGLKTLEKGQKVEYRVGANRRGDCAVEITLAQQARR